VKLLAFRGVDVTTTPEAGLPLAWFSIRPKEMHKKGLASFLTQALSGAEGDRTPNLRIANAALSQLSYGPCED
jgi:hypothetical protein